MTARAAIIATLASLAASAACSERESPPVSSPWVRTMTLAERRAWVTRCSGDEQVRVFEGRDFVRYSAARQVTMPRLDGRVGVQRQLWCDLEWDGHRGRLHALRVSIRGSKDDALVEALVAPYVELVLAEMTPAAREVAFATRWDSFAYGCVDPRSREFGVSCEIDESSRWWNWRFSVEAK